MKLDQPPSTTIAYGEDDNVHIFGDMFGDPWCEDEKISLGLGYPLSTVEQAGNLGDLPWCDGCLDGLVDEGLVVLS